MSPIVLEAIALHKRLTATYNRQQIVLAPHVLYTKHGELYLDAVTLEREGQPPREEKLGAFKLSGLHDLALVEQPFAPSRLFDPRDARYEGVTLFAIEARPAAAA